MARSASGENSGLALGEAGVIQLAGGETIFLPFTGLSSIGATVAAAWLTRLWKNSPNRTIHTAWLP